MLHVTQGHEKSISIEVFLKSFLLLSNKDQKKIIYYASIEEIKNSCLQLSLDFTLNNQEVFINGAHLNVINIESQSQLPQTTLALEKALESINEKDILVTMPSSKDQIILNGKNCAGHTDYFRQKYKDNKITMLFKNKWESLLLMTDHIPLNRVSKSINEEVIINKISHCIKEYQRFFGDLTRVVIAGINPHAGEGGLLGIEESTLISSYEKIKELSGNIEVIGPLAADSLHNYTSPNTLKIFMYHDQGLTYFKGKYGFIGANITLGLPFLRVSVDHGTAFDLYGKDKANYMGCYTLLKEILKRDTK